MRFSRFSLVSLISFVSISIVPTASAELSFILNVDRVRDAGGTDYVSTATGLWIVVADTAQDGFQPITSGGVNVNDFVSDNDLVIFRGDFTTFFTDGVATSAATGLNFGNGWDTGDPLAFVWFPTAGTSATSVTGGEDYGIYTSPVPVDSSDAWITPADGTLDHTLQMVTTDNLGLFDPGGTVDPSAATASLQVIPEPSVSLLALLSGLLVFRRRR